MHRTQADAVAAAGRLALRSGGAEVAVDIDRADLPSPDEARDAVLGVSDNTIASAPS